MSKDTILKEGVERNNLQMPAFTRKYLDEEKEETEGERIQVRINAQERADIEWLKAATNYGQDAKVIKQAIKVYKNVINNTLGYELIQDISAQDRRRPTKKTMEQK